MEFLRLAHAAAQPARPGRCAAAPSHPDGACGQSPALRPAADSSRAAGAGRAGGRQARGPTAARRGLPGKRARRYVVTTQSAGGPPRPPIVSPASLRWPKCRAAIGSGWPMRRPAGRSRAGSIWRWCWVWPRARWWAGPRGRRWIRSSPPEPSSGRWWCGSLPPGCCTTRTKAVTTRGRSTKESWPATSAS